MDTAALACFLTFSFLLGAYLPRPPFLTDYPVIWADIALLFSAALFLRRLRPVELLKDRSVQALSLFCGWVLLSALFTGSGLWRAAGVMELAAVFLLARSFAYAAPVREKIESAFVAGVAVLCLAAVTGTILEMLGMSSLLTGSGGMWGIRLRPKGLCITTNMLSSLALCAFALLLPEEKPKGRNLLLGLFLFILLLGLSRSLLAFAALFFLRRYFHSERWKFAVGIAVTLTALFLAARFDFVRPGEGVGFFPGTGLRWRIMSAALDTFLAHPLFGAGPGSLVAQLTDLQFSAHLTWLDTAASYGLPALAFLLLFLYFVLKNVKGAMALVMFVILFDSLSMDIEHFRHFWLMLGLSAASVRPNPCPSTKDASAGKP